MSQQSENEAQPTSQSTLKFLHSLTGFKHILYLILALFSFMLFIVSCVIVPFERDQYGG